jgi:hypothetical protein
MESFWDKNETSWRVLCIDCIAETAGDTKEQAIAAWNRRVDHLPDATKMVSNADRMRGMTDEELANYIFYLGNGSEYCYGHCAYQNNCTTKGLDHDTCIKGVIDWLQQPAKEELT